MQPIGRPFRITLDFAVVWVLLPVPVIMLMRGLDIGPWYSRAAAVMVLSLFATFLLYGPVLLARQIVRSGSHGWFVLRVFLSILFMAFLYAAVLFFSGYGEHASWTGTASFVAIVYLHWRLRNERRS